MVFYTSEIMLGDNSYFSKSNRHFPSSLLMSNHIINVWNKTVSESDDVYIVGGVGDFEYLKSLNGNKRLIMSRHESEHFRNWLKKNSKNNEADDLDYELYNKFLLEKYGITSVCHSGKIVRKMSTGKLVRVTTESWYAKPGIFNLHGCVGDFQRMTSSGLNVGIDVNNYYPVSETEIEYYSKHIDKLV